jgi:uncharacterized protein YbjT (DUF2867 family)
MVVIGGTGLIGTKLVKDLGERGHDVLAASHNTGVNTNAPVWEDKAVLEFFGGIAQSATVGEEIRLSPALIQPIASADVAAALAEVAVAPPVNGTGEVAGPEAMPLDEQVRLRATQDTRKVVPDGYARHFGGLLSDRTLTPGENPRIGAIRFEDWLGRSTAQEAT